MEMTTFAHGNVVQVQSTETLNGFGRFGWGTELYLQPPAPEHVDDLGDVYPTWGPGTWCHMPLTNDFDSVGDYRWRLVSIMLHFHTINSRVRHIHVYDGTYQLASFEGYGSAYGDDFGLSGDFSESPFEEKIEDRPKIYSGIGISFYVAVSNRDIRVSPDGDSPPSVTISGAGVRLWRPNRLSMIFSDLVRLDPQWRYP